jgi:hypothetical protein
MPGKLWLAEKKMVLQRSEESAAGNLLAYTIKLLQETIRDETSNSNFYILLLNIVLHS